MDIEKNWRDAKLVFRLEEDGMMVHLYNLEEIKIKSELQDRYYELRKNAYNKLPEGVRNEFSEHISETLTSSVTLTHKDELVKLIYNILIGELMKFEKNYIEKLEALEKELENKNGKDKEK